VLLVGTFTVLACLPPVCAFYFTKCFQNPNVPYIGPNLILWYLNHRQCMQRKIARSMFALEQQMRAGSPVTPVFVVSSPALAALDATPQHRRHCGLHMYRHMRPPRRHMVALTAAYTTRLHSRTAPRCVDAGTVPRRRYQERREQLLDMQQLRIASLLAAFTAVLADGDQQRRATSISAIHT
jgi:hypothetical protein